MSNRHFLHFTALCLLVLFAAACGGRTGSVELAAGPTPKASPATIGATLPFPADRGAAVLKSDVIVGDQPLTVIFDAGLSTDSDGSIVEYAWDWDGDGLYDGFSDSPLATHVFTQAGKFSVKLRVTDDQFAHGTATQLIDV